MVMLQLLKYAAGLASLGVACGQLYLLTPGDVPIALNLPEMESIPATTIESVMKSFGLTLSGLEKVRFDRATDALEVMRLPHFFFSDYLTAPQLIEIILNRNLKSLISSKREPKLLGKVRDKSLLKMKLDTMHRKLALLDLDSLGANHDRVIKRLPTRLYRYVHPYVALVSQEFKNTVKGLVSLFGICWEVVRKLAGHIRSAIYSVIDSAIEALTRFRQDERVVKVAKILEPIIRYVPELTLTALKITLIIAQIAAFVGILALKSNHAVLQDPQVLWTQANKAFHEYFCLPANPLVFPTPLPFHCRVGPALPPSFPLQNLPLEGEANNEVFLAQPSGHESLRSSSLDGSLGSSGLDEYPSTSTVEIQSSEGEDGFEADFEKPPIFDGPGVLQVTVTLP